MLRNCDCTINCEWNAYHQFLPNATIQVLSEYIQGFSFTHLHYKYLKITKFFNTLMSTSFLFQILQSHSYTLKKIHFLKILQKFLMHFTLWNGSISYCKHLFWWCVSCKHLICEIRFATSGLTHVHCGNPLFVFCGI